MLRRADVSLIRRIVSVRNYTEHVCHAVVPLNLVVWKRKEILPGSTGHLESIGGIYVAERFMSTTFSDQSESD